METGERVGIDDAERLVAALGRPHATIVPHGRNNWVFICGDECISIPRRPDKVSYGVRVCAITHLQNHGIPTTPIVEHGYCSGSEYLITRRVQGGHVDLRAAENPDAIHQQCGEWLSRIHDIPIAARGRIDRDMRGSHSSWCDFVSDYFEQSMRRLSVDRDLYGKYALPLRRRYNSIVLTDHGSLLHGDFHIGNMLFRGNRLAAILDLDIVMGGDPHWDIGHYCHTCKHDRIRGNAAFLRGYGKPIDLHLADDYAAVIWARKLASQAESRRDALPETVAELDAILR